MKSASQMSLEIRRKKKQLRDGEVDLSSGPSMDATDLMEDEQDEMTSDLGLDHNQPKTAHQELMEDSDRRKHEMKAPLSDKVKMMAKGGEMKAMSLPKLAEGGEVMDDAKMKRMSRLAKRMKGC